MMDEHSLQKLAKEIMAQGVDETNAWHYAALIGDTPLIRDKKVIVRDGVREIATLDPLEYFDMK